MDAIGTLPPSALIFIEGVVLLIAGAVTVQGTSWTLALAGRIDNKLSLATGHPQGGIVGLGAWLVSAAVGGVVWGIGGYVGALTLDASTLVLTILAANVLHTSRAGK